MSCLNVHMSYVKPVAERCYANKSECGPGGTPVAPSVKYLYKALNFCEQKAFVTNWGHRV